MSADPILYCLERLTDYRQLERLASDIMVGVGYENLEPIGGTGDGGRDALHINRVDGRITVFAYSARSDWETKLAADLERIRELDEQPDEVVFVSTREIGAQARLWVGRGFLRLRAPTRATRRPPIQVATAASRHICAALVRTAGWRACYSDYSQSCCHRPRSSRPSGRNLVVSQANDYGMVGLVRRTCAVSRRRRRPDDSSNHRPACHPLPAGTVQEERPGSRASGSMLGSRITRRSRNSVLAG